MTNCFPRRFRTESSPSEFPSYNNRHISEHQVWLQEIPIIRKQSARKKVFSKLPSKQKTKFYPFKLHLDLNITQPKTDWSKIGYKKEILKCFNCVSLNVGFIHNSLETFNLNPFISVFLNVSRIKCESVFVIWI